MRKGLLSCVASTLAGAGAAFAQPPGYLPSSPDAQPGLARVVVGAPVLLPATPDVAAPAADPGLTGGSTGLRPGIDCLPDPGEVCKRSPRLNSRSQSRTSKVSMFESPAKSAKPL